MTKALVFPGQGSQTVGMGKDLYDAYAAARDVFQEVDEALSQSLSKIIFEGPMETLTQTQNAQPALMAMSMAVVRVMQKELGISLQGTFQFVAGHSLGEYSALCAAGALSVADTAKLLRRRGEAMARAGEKNPGAMAAIIGLSMDDVRQVVTEAGCFVANDNSIGQVVISGTQETVEKACTIASARGAKRALVLPVSGAFHSPLMQEAADEMKAVLMAAPMQNPVIPVVSNISATAQTDAAQIKELLYEQITGSVRWTQSVQYMHGQGVDTLVEAGAGKVLTGLTKRIVPDMGAVSVNSVLTLEEFSKSV